MNDTLLEELLNEDESSTLDFKRDQYPFSKATDEQKSELLKDILAFANSWRRTEAYILIGVNEIKGGRSTIYGVSEHLNDSQLQQFVNSKTQRPILFSYLAYPYEGKQIGILKIELQNKPIYLNQNFGKLNKKTVYIRRGSSTGEADPDEVARIGKSSIEDLNPSPLLKLDFANLNERTNLGLELNSLSTIVEYDKSEVKPKPRHPSFDYSISSTYKDENYPIKMASYIKKTSILNFYGFVMQNNSSTLAGNVRLEIESNLEDYTILDEYEYPIKPVRSMIPIAGIHTSGIHNFNAVKKKLTVNVYNNKWLLKADFGNIQPGATIFCKNGFYIGAIESCRIKLDGVIYADNLHKPIIVPLSIDIETETKKLDIGMI